MHRFHSFALALALSGSMAAFGILLAPASATAAGHSLAPIADAEAVSAHAPYLSGQCSMCHEPGASAGKGKSPGKISGDVNALCAECHSDMAEAIKTSSVVHAPATTSCTNCHNPHNSAHPRLLIAQPKNLCLSCHAEIRQIIAGAKVQHKAVIDKTACLNCHDPHASNVQFLLTSLPYDLCVSCHSEDDKVDARGRMLTNFNRLLAEKPYLHGPVQEKDCSACHLTHGSNNHSLLVADYPPRFYSPYEPKNYALCYRCHNDANMTDPRTTTTTRFRDGSRNLHYLHVNKSDQGRTCRACHEIHASENPHQIRNAVPFGSRNWMLPINYVKNETGGSCARTCHQTKTYDYTKE